MKIRIEHWTFCNFHVISDISFHINGENIINKFRLKLLVNWNRSTCNRKKCKGKEIKFINRLFFIVRCCLWLLLLFSRYRITNHSYAIAISPQKAKELNCRACPWESFLAEQNKNWKQNNKNISLLAVV